jgi:hypothetical protein
VSRSQGREQLRTATNNDGAREPLDQSGSVLMLVIVPPSLSLRDPPLAPEGEAVGWPWTEGTPAPTDVRPDQPYCPVAMTRLVRG